MYDVEYMDRIRQIVGIYGEEVKEMSFDDDVSFFLDSIIDEIKLRANRDDIPDKYMGLVYDIVGYELLLSYQDIKNNSNSNLGEISSITEGDTRTEFSHKESSKNEVSKIGKKCNELKRNLIYRIRKIRW